MSTQVLTQRGNVKLVQRQVTRHDVDRAWREAVMAADLFESRPTERNRENMHLCTEYASELQSLYYQQYEEWVVSL